MVLWDTLLGLFGKREQKLSVVFIDETGHEHPKKVSYKNNVFHTKINGEEGSYIVDHNYIVHDGKNRPKSYYYTNNPNPIRIQHARNEVLDSISFKRIIDSKVVTDLFAEEGLGKLFILLILIAANCALTVFVLLVVLKVVKIGTP